MGPGRATRRAPAYEAELVAEGDLDGRFIMLTVYMTDTPKLASTRG